MRDIAHSVKCYYCNNTFDRDKEPYVQVSARRYAHAACAREKGFKTEVIDPSANLSQEEKDKIQLFNYLKKLFNVEKLNAKIYMQVNSYIEKYQYTYTGMQKALIYFYEVQGNEVDTTNPTLGIIPYIYDEAYNYYYELWKINKENSNKDLEHFCPETLEVHIPPPQRKIKKRKLFTFLDKEGEDK